MQKTTGGMAIATLVAGLVACGGSQAEGETPSGATEGSVKCGGANACAGKGACATADHACGGKNACKGKGWIKTSSAEECTSKGGTVL